MSPHRRLLAPALLLPALAVAAQVALAPSRAPSALPVARAQPQGPTRYLDLVFDRTTRTNDVVYGTAIDKPTGRAVDLKMDIYEPVGDTAASRPVFVFLFGGGFTQGTKELEPRVYCEQMARRGYVAIAPSYRLNQGDIAKDGIPAAVSDARQAVRWLRANAAAYRLDPTRIVIGGSSAGAITSLFLAYTDVERPAGDDVRGAGSDVALVMDLWGGLYNQVNDLEAGAPPLAIVHGTADNVVPFTEATKLRDRAEAVGVPYVFHPLEGKGHAPYMPVELMTMVAPFLYAQLWPVGAPRMPDLGATDHLAVNYRAESLGQTQAATIDVTRTADGWRGMAGFEVKDWRSERLRTVTSTVPVALSDAAMTAFLTTLARTELTEHLDGPTATATPFDWSATYAFVLSVGGDDIVGLTSHPWTTNPRHERPYVVAIGDHTWRTDDDAPDRALEAIDPALRWDELDRLLRESAATPFVRTATMTAPSATAAPTAVRTVPPEGESGGRVWLPVGMR
ncbi:MAG: alpha/beta hydrolase [Ardenticatenales bacterium]